MLNNMVDSELQDKFDNTDMLITDEMEIYVDIFKWLLIQYKLCLVK